MEYNGQADLGDAIVTVAIDDVDAEAWTGYVLTPKPAGVFAPGSVFVELLSAPRAGWGADAEIVLAFDGSHVLSGNGRFRADPNGSAR
jgi:hypothetical protein